MSDERHEREREFDLLDRIDLLIATLPPGDAMRRELLDLRMEICQREEVFVEARQTIEKLEEVIKKVTSPANRIGTFLGYEPAGPVTKITEVIGTDRLRVGNEHGTQSLVLQRSAQLAKTALKQGDEVRVDSNYRMALEMMSAPGSHEIMLVRAGCRHHFQRHAIIGIHPHFVALFQRRFRQLRGTLQNQRLRSVFIADA